MCNPKDAPGPGDLGSEEDYDEFEDYCEDCGCERELCECECDGCGEPMHSCICGEH